MSTDFSFIQFQVQGKRVHRQSKWVYSWTVEICLPGWILVPLKIQSTRRELNTENVCRHEQSRETLFSQFQPQQLFKKPFG